MRRALLQYCKDDGGWEAAILLLEHSRRAKVKFNLFCFDMLIAVSPCWMLRLLLLLLFSPCCVGLKLRNTLQLSIFGKFAPMVLTATGLDGVAALKILLGVFGQCPQEGMTFYTILGAVHSSLIGRCPNIYGMPRQGVTPPSAPVFHCLWCPLSPVVRGRPRSH